MGFFDLLLGGVDSRAINQYKTYCRESNSRLEGFLKDFLKGFTPMLRFTHIPSDDKKIIMLALAHRGRADKAYEYAKRCGYSKQDFKEYTNNSTLYSAARAIIEKWKE